MTGKTFLNSVANGKIDIMRLVETHPELKVNLPPDIAARIE